MALSSDCRRSTTAAVIFLSAALYQFAAVESIGVNYGTLGDNLPPPAQVAQFIKDKTIFDRVKIFDANPDILRAFANTDILVAITIPNLEILNLVDAEAGRSWVDANVKPFYPQTKINYILIGNEILHGGRQDLIDNLVPAMKSIQNAVASAGLADKIKVTTAHALSLLQNANPPSHASFRAGWDVGVLSPMLTLLQSSNSPFMVNTYPFFDYAAGNENFTLFRPNSGSYDDNTQKTYYNDLDLMIDAIHISMKKLGFENVDIAIGETGWASLGDGSDQQKCTVDNAGSYNRGVVNKVKSGTGTPLLPNRNFETYIFALFNENQKTGGTSEKNFGLFRPDFSPVYDAGIARG